MLRRYRTSAWSRDSRRAWCTCALNKTEGAWVLGWGESRAELPGILFFFILGIVDEQVGTRFLRAWSLAFHVSLLDNRATDQIVNHSLVVLYGPFVQNLQLAHLVLKLENSSFCHLVLPA